MIREFNEYDSPSVLEIYKLGLETLNASFETQIPSWHEWDCKFHKHSRFVYEENSKVIGWVALSGVSTRAVYAGVAEISIYVDTRFLSRGIGSMLMGEVIVSSEKNGIWTLVSSIFPENIATLRLHEKFGFRIVGIRERIARLDNKWRNTLLLERRSEKVGTD